MRRTDVVARGDRASGVVEQWEARGAPYGLPAFTRGLGGDAARVDDSHVGAVRGRGRESAGAQERGELLALVVVDPAPEGRDGESSVVHGACWKGAYSIESRQQSVVSS